MLGSEIRSLLTTRHPDNVLIGSDLSSLENRLKFHFQMPLDPEYVKSQMSADFDPHLAIAVSAGLLTQDEANFYKVVSGGFPASDYKTEALDTMLSWSEEFQGEEVKRISKIRGIGKGGNYSCLPMDTEVLTKDGFKSFDELEVGDEIPQLDLLNGHTVSKILYKHFYRNARVLEISFDGVSIKCTEDHRWLCFENGCFVLKTLGEILERSLPIIIGCEVYDTSCHALLGTTYEDVFCLTTETGTFFIQQNGVLTVTGNCQYGAGAKTVARATKTSMDVAKMIVEGYREMNWSIDVIAKNTFVKRTSFGDFQLNPLNKMFYPLKTDKDRFSTLIQGSGSYVLDLWLMFIEKRLDMAVEAGAVKFRPMLIGQMHDECIYECHKDDAAFVRKLIKDAIGDVNQAMKLEVDLDCDVQQGLKYSEIH